MTRTLQIVMPMAGLGSRFAKAGFDQPKPLIPVDGMAMFKKALTSLDAIAAPKRFLFVIRQEHVDTQQLDQLIKDHLPEAEVIVLPKLTDGAAETVLMAAPSLNPDDALIAMDCDLWFNSDSYNTMVEASLAGRSDISGGLLTFKADSPRYSYAQVDNHHMVTRTAEKEAISPWAITGAYFFARAETFVQAATELTQMPLDETRPEYYLSYVYNILLDQGAKIQAATIDKYASFGTPEELAAYENR